MSLNTRGLANEEKRRSIFGYCRARADIIALQETHSTQELCKIWSAEWGGKIIFSHGRSDARGVCVLISPSLNCKYFTKYIDENGRLLIVEIKLEGDFTFVLVNVYAPNKDSPEFFNNLRNKLAHTCERKVVIGDFNLTFNIQLDRLNSVTNNNKNLRILEAICEEFFLEGLLASEEPK